MLKGGSPGSKIGAHTERGIGRSWRTAVIDERFAAWLGS